MPRIKGCTIVAAPVEGLRIHDRTLLQGPAPRQSLQSFPAAGAGSVAGTGIAVSPLRKNDDQCQRKATSLFRLPVPNAEIGHGAGTCGMVGVRCLF